jgi:hypothetical protein
VVEKGIEPISAVVVGSGATTSRSFANAARKLANPIPVPQKPVPGKKELVESLKRAENESVLFGANLGNVEVAHRGTLNAAFTADLRRRTVEAVDGQPSAVLDESLRVVEDALSCVENIEFLGQKSKRYTLPGNGGEGNFCSVPIRLTFSDRETRMHFERTIRTNTGLKASQSLPPVLRSQMAAFRKALEARYEGDMIMTRPDSSRLEFIAYRREGGVGKWLSLPEVYQIPPQCMLPGFVAPDTIELPPMAAGVVAGAEGGEGMAVG